MKTKRFWLEGATLVLGMFLASAAVYYIMMPGEFAVGSLSGLVMILANFIPLKVSTITFLLNGILLILGFVFVGKEFGTKTVFTSMLLPAFLWLFERITPNAEPLTDDMLLNMLCYILVVSCGQALLFQANASSGGLDIAAKILNKYFHIEIGKSLVILGFITAFMSILVYDRKTLVISLLGTYLGGSVLDHFLNGFHIRKKVCIVSEKYEEIQSYIIRMLGCGATLYPAYGGLSQKEYMEVVTILEKNASAKLIAFVHATDPNAFMTVYTVGEVAGLGNGKIEVGGGGVK